jgi:hypothetical protein
VCEDFVCGLEELTGESRKKANKIIHSKKKAYLKKKIENIEF